MTEEFDNELADTDVESIVTTESIVESSIVPPESSAEEAFAAAANAIPAAGGPIVVDPYAILGTAAAPAAASTLPTQTYVAPGYHHPPVNYGYPGGQYAPQHSTDGFAIAALACGIAGLVFFAPVIGSILGIIFGIIALQRIRMSGARGRGLAIAGIVTGALGLLLGLAALVTFISFGVWHGPFWM